MFSYLKKKFFRKSTHETRLLPVNTECTICLSNIDEPYKTKCNHYFHKECLDQWILIKSNCPNCRKSLKYLKPKRKERTGLFIRRLRRVNHNRIVPEEEPELQIEESLPAYIPEQLPTYAPVVESFDDEEIGQLNGICAECGRNVYQSYNRHPDGHLIYHKRCFQIMFQRNGRQL